MFHKFIFIVDRDVQTDNNNNVFIQHCPVVVSMSNELRPVRPADALRIDFVSAISLVVIFFQQKFGNTRLDLIALVSVSVWVKEHFRRHLNS